MYTIAAYFCRLLFRAVDRKFHASVCLCTLSRLHPLWTSAAVSVSNFPAGDVLMRDLHDSYQEASFCMIPSVSGPRDLVFLSAKRRGVLARQARGRQTKTSIKLTAINKVYTHLSSPPWLVWLTTLWTNLDRNGNFSASCLSEIPPTSVTQNRLSYSSRSYPC